MMTLPMYAHLPEGVCEYIYCSYTLHLRTIKGLSIPNDEFPLCISVVLAVILLLYPCRPFDAVPIYVIAGSVIYK